MKKKSKQQYFFLVSGAKTAVFTCKQLLKTFLAKNKYSDKFLVTKLPVNKASKAKAVKASVFKPKAISTNELILHYTRIHKKTGVTFKYPMYMSGLNAGACKKAKNTKELEKILSNNIYTYVIDEDIELDWAN